MAIPYSFDITCIIDRKFWCQQLMLLFPCLCYIDAMTSKVFYFETWWRICMLQDRTIVTRILYIKYTQVKWALHNTNTCLYWFVKYEDRFISKLTTELTWIIIDLRAFFIHFVPDYVTLLPLNVFEAKCRLLVTAIKLLLDVCMFAGRSKKGKFYSCTAWWCENLFPKEK